MDDPIVKFTSFNKDEKNKGATCLTKISILKVYKLILELLTRSLRILSTWSTAWQLVLHSMRQMSLHDDLVLTSVLLSHILTIFSHFPGFFSNNIPVDLKIVFYRCCRPEIWSQNSRIPWKNRTCRPRISNHLVYIQWTGFLVVKFIEKIIVYSFKN